MSYRATTYSENDSNLLLDSKLSNLTVNQIPPDQTQMVVGVAKKLSISERLVNLLTGYKAQIQQIANPEEGANAVTCVVPTELLREIITLIAASVTTNLPDCVILYTTLLGLVTNYTKPTINITRAIWKQMTRATDELSLKENNVNIATAAARILAMPVSTDVQTVANEKLLDASLVVDADSSDSWLDPDFLNLYPEAADTQLTIDDAMTITNAENAMAIGESSDIAPTNEVNTDLEAGSDEITLEDVETDTVLKEAAEGLEDLFSVTNTSAPLEKLNLVDAVVDGQPSVNIDRVVSVSSVGITGANDKTIATVQDLKNVLKITNYTVVRRGAQTLDGVDMTKNIMEQDWAVSALSNTASTIISKHILQNGEPDAFIPVHQFLEVEPELLRADTTLYKGCYSGRVMNAQQVRAISSSLSGIWNKMVGSALPTISHVNKAASIIGQGLSVVGSITGCAGLVNASNIMGVLSNGLGSLLPKTSLRLANPNVTPQSSIYRHCLAILPAAISAGVATIKKHTLSAKDMRLYLKGVSNKVIREYGAVSEVVTAKSIISARKATLRTKRHSRARLH